MLEIISPYIFDPAAFGELDPETKARLEAAAQQHKLETTRLGDLTLRAFDEEE